MRQLREREWGEFICYITTNISLTDLDSLWSLNNTGIFFNLHFDVFSGTMFALTASFEVLETLLASVIFNNIYSATVDWMPGFCYLLMSAIILIPIFLMM